MCRIPVERRRITRKKTRALGIFPGAKVSRGPDWEYGDHDDGKFGEVTKITDWHGNPASGAEVSWESGTKGTYRLGYQGKVYSRPFNNVYLTFCISSRLFVNNSLSVSCDVSR